MHRWRNQSTPQVPALPVRPHWVQEEERKHQPNKDQSEKQQIEKFGKIEKASECPPPPIDTKHASRVEIALHSDIADLQKDGEAEHDQIEQLVYGFNRHDAINKVQIAESRRTQEDAANKTYEIVGFPSTEGSRNKHLMLDWILQKADTPRELTAEKRFQRTGARNKNSVDKAKIAFTEPAPKRILDQHMKNNKINYAVGIIIWHEYYLQGRWTESKFAQEAQAILNTLWQVFKNDLGLGAQWIESEQGAYLRRATSSIRSKRNHMPLIQIIMDEISQNRGDPTCWVFTPVEYQPKDQNIGYTKKMFNAKWSEDRNTSLENHNKRVEQQRAQHSDPMVPNLSQLVPHTNLKDIQTPDYWNVQFRTLENLENTYPNFFGEKTNCGQKRNNPMTTRKEKYSPKDKESQQTTKTTTKTRDKNPTPQNPREKRREKASAIMYEYEYKAWGSQFPHYGDRWDWNPSSGGASSSGWQDWNRSCW